MRKKQKRLTIEENIVAFVTSVSSFPHSLHYYLLVLSFALRTNGLRVSYPGNQAGF
jgi:hypothetical protein